MSTPEELFQRVLVPLDFTDANERALAAACQLAEVNQTTSVRKEYIYLDGQPVALLSNASPVTTPPQVVASTNGTIRPVDRSKTANPRKSLSHFLRSIE